MNSTLSYGAKVARTVMVGGLVVSVGGNLLHSQLEGQSHNLWAVLGNSLPPFFLLGCVEILLSLRWRSGFWALLTRWGLLPTLAIIGFYLSWIHIEAVILDWSGPNDSPWPARLYPVMIDAAMLLAGAALVLEDRTPGAAQAGEGSGPVREATGPASDPQEDQAGLTGPDQDEEDRTGPPDPPPGPPTRRRLQLASSSKPSRVEALLPAARKIAERNPDIGWKALADELRKTGVQCGTETARTLREVLTEENREGVVNG